MKPRRCEAFVGSDWSYQIERYQRCQNQPLAHVAGAWLCGTHINSIYERPIRVITEISMEERECR